MNSSFYISDFYSMTILYNLLMKNNNSVEFNHTQDLPIDAFDFSSLLNMSLVNMSNDYEDSDINYLPYPDFTQITLVRVLFLVSYTIVMFLALFGNSVVCYTVISNRKMQTVVNCYIVNLAVCDFLVGAFVLPVKLLRTDGTGTLVRLQRWCLHCHALLADRHCLLQRTYSCCHLPGEVSHYRNISFNIKNKAH